jgi:hypothetical protein
MKASTQAWNDNVVSYTDAVRDEMRLHLEIAELAVALAQARELQLYALEAADDPEMWAAIEEAETAWRNGTDTGDDPDTIRERVLAHWNQ